MVVSAPIKDIGTIEQIKSLYAAKEDYKGLLLFSLAINTGINLKVLLDLNVGDIRGKEYIALDTKKSIPLNAEIKHLAEKIIDVKNNNTPLFTSYKSNNRLDRTTVFYKFKEICKELALGEEITVASWRKTFGYHYYQKYKDLSFLQWYFSQDRVDSTLQYIDVSENVNLRFKEGVCL